MIIEHAGVQDAAEILELQHLAYLSEAGIYNDYTIAPLVQTAEEIEADFRSRVFLKALKDGAIVGSVRARLDHDTCMIGKLIVHPDHQNRGIGTKLMNEIEGCFDQAGRFELFTGHKSERNLHLYRKLGYRIFRNEKISEQLTIVFLEKRREGGRSLRMNSDVEAEISRLAEASDDELRSHDLRRSEKRLQWLRSHRPDENFPNDSVVLKAYRVLLELLQATEAECPIVYRNDEKLVFHSRNFCPTLEACKILGMDTRHICKLYNERSTDRLVKEVHPNLKFTRNYEKLRPYCEYCEEMIVLEE
jgi:ribosomal protein S18 acetylase RimI-like enzyme